MKQNQGITGLIMVLGVTACVLVAVRLKIETLDDVGREVTFEAANEVQPSETLNRIRATTPKVRVQILDEGSGRKPVTGDRLLIHYRGSFPGGEEFDSSHKSKTPFQFVLGYGQVLKGLEDGIRRLPVGSRARMQIPWQLAYGEEGIDGVIPPRQDLVYEVELLQAEKSGIPDHIPDTAGLAKKKHKGVEYYVLEDSDGPYPKRGQRVSVHFVGWLSDGRVFDSSVGRGIPFSFLIGGKVIEGWNRILPQMRVGQKILAVLPPHLAYGDRSPGGIPAQSTLIFQIELLDIL